MMTILRCHAKLLLKPFLWPCSNLHVINLDSVEIDGLNSVPGGIIYKDLWKCDIPCSILAPWHLQPILVLRSTAWLYHSEPPEHHLHSDQLGELGQQDHLKAEMPKGSLVRSPDPQDGSQSQDVTIQLLKTRLPFFSICGSQISDLATKLANGTDYLRCVEWAMFFFYKQKIGGV